MSYLILTLCSLGVVVAIVLAVCFYTVPDSAPAKTVKTLARMWQRAPDESVWHPLLQQWMDNDKLYDSLMQEMAVHVKTEPVVLTAAHEDKSQWPWGPTIVLYINLDEHTSRRQQIEQEIRKMFARTDNVQVFRLSARKKSPGALGCLLSHLYTLAVVQARYPQHHVLVLEDDFTFTDPSRFDLMTHMAPWQLLPAWDVLVWGQYTWSMAKVLARDPIQRDTSIRRLYHATSTSGYLVNQSYLSKLTQHWLRHYSTVASRIQFEPQDHLDQAQIELQQKDKWYGLRLPVGGQRAGMSSIENRPIHYAWQPSPDESHWKDGCGVWHDLTLLSPEYL